MEPRSFFCALSVFHMEHSNAALLLLKLYQQGELCSLEFKHLLALLACVCLHAKYACQKISQAD